jgi:hypothetical protein
MLIGELIKRDTQNATKEHVSIRKTEIASQTEDARSPNPDGSYLGVAV